MNRIMRIAREGETIRVLALTPAASGRARWRLLATLKGSDRVPLRCCPEKTSPARVASDADIIAALGGVLEAET